MRRPGDIDVLDEQGLRTGEILGRAAVHRHGKLHRAVHLYLFDRSNRLLLQRRSLLVENPGVLTISVVGHVDAGESSHEAAIRELGEELGVDAGSSEVEFLFSYRRDAELSPTLVDRQFNDVYVCWADFRLEDVGFDHREVSEVKLVNFAEFVGMVEHRSGGLATVYGEECPDLVYFLRHRLAGSVDWMNSAAPLRSWQHKKNRGESGCAGTPSKTN